MATKQRDFLFELPIGSEGDVVCTMPKDKVYIITFRYPPDNRLRAVSPELDSCEARWKRLTDHCFSAILRSSAPRPRYH